MSIELLCWAFKQHLPCPEKFVLVALADMADMDGKCWPSQALLAERCGIARETVNRQIKMLATAGLIRIEHRANRHGQQASLYFVRCDSGSHPDVIVDHGGVTDDHTEPSLNPQIEKEREAKASPKKGSRWEGVVSLDWVNEVPAVRAHYGLPPLNAELEADKFADYWDTRNDAGAIKRDWHKTWLNWIRNAKQERTNGRGQSPNTKLYAGFAEAAGYCSTDRPADESLLDGGRSDGDPPGAGRGLDRRPH